MNDPVQLELFAPMVRVWTPDEEVAYVDVDRYRVSMNAMQLNAFAEECRHVANLMLRHAPRRAG